ncbi:purine and uridine phosphorylase [Viridothelium virens]|uniref:Purine and uridine phosphorylase n=1 Tax=Viridothelium virens TaxID=1048519 RepID=A0A6A6H9Z2_VIRVR|nr:purine and uridine phosphorylase [Viridothelium virens]
MRLRLEPEEYLIALLCALPTELDAVRAVLDEEHEVLQQDKNDSNHYCFGSIGGHNAVLACPPAAQTGISSAAAVVAQMMISLRWIRFALMVGIGGGVPSGNADIRLGDVVVSYPGETHGRVIQYDFGETIPNGFAQTGLLKSPPPVLLSAVAKVRANHREKRSKLSIHSSRLHDLPEFMFTPTEPDNLFEASYDHIRGTTCEACNSQKKVKRKPRKKGEVVIHYGLVASGNQVIRDGRMRENASKAFGDVLCFEMEAAGLMNDFPCLFIRGISDYADSHKNKGWQACAAGAAATYAKELLLVIPPTDIVKIPKASEIISRAQVFYPPPPSLEGVPPVNRSVDQASEMSELGTDQSDLRIAKKTDARVLHNSSSHGFEVREKPRQYFKKGRFFMLHWSEPTGVNSSVECLNFQKIRRFMVIRGRPAHCLCLVVHTYGSQGTSKIGARASDHAVVIPAGKPVVLHPEEKELKKDPIQIIVEDSRVELDHTARLDFSRVYTVEYNLPVRNIGRIHPKDLSKFESYFIISVDIRPHEVKADEDYQMDELSTTASINAVV